MISVNKVLLSLSFLSLIVLAACTKYILDDGEIPESVEYLNSGNIETQLAIVNIEVVGSEFEYMYTYYTEDIGIVAYISMLENGQEILPRRKVEISIKGSSTIHYPLKSLKIKFDKALNNYLTPIIKVEKHIARHHFTSLKKISLRNSGNDFYESNVKDISYTQMAIDMGLQIELNYYRPVQVFINNKYYGLLNLRTEKGKLGISRLLEVNDDDLNILKISHISANEELIEFLDGSDVVLQEFVDAVDNSDTEKLKEMVDIESFIDYIVYEDYIGNSDWPYNNIEAYNVGENGKFRFFLYDLDFSGTRDKFFASDANSNTFLYKIYEALKRDPQIYQQIKDKQKAIYHYCYRDRFKAIITRNAEMIEDEIIYNISKYKVPESRIHWYYELDALNDQQQLRRENYQKEYGL